MIVFGGRLEQQIGILQQAYVLTILKTAYLVLAIDARFVGPHLQSLILSHIIFKPIVVTLTYRADHRLGLGTMRKPGACCFPFTKPGSPSLVGV